MKKEILNEVSRIKNMMKQLNEDDFTTDNEEPKKKVKKVPMIKDIIEKAKLSQWVKDNRIDIGWKHDWLKRPRIMKALADLKIYEISVETVEFNHLITKFIKTYDDGVDKLEVVYDRDVRKSS
jgi:hypothetical protein